MSVFVYSGSSNEGIEEKKYDGVFGRNAWVLCLSTSATSKYGVGCEVWGLMPRYRKSLHVDSANASESLSQQESLDRIRSQLKTGGAATARDGFEIA